ncbi:MAG: ABC transporter permease [Clostridiales Family XIII bacterium]|jgi:ABC-2 type transport system permease protein|nr:ABC transporter permease [Clostridiales Family XIII bacterium]
MIALMQRIIKQIAGDKRTIAMIVVAPLFILTLLNLLLGETDYDPTIAIDAAGVPPAISSALMEQKDVYLIETDISDADEYLSDNKNVDAVLSKASAGLTISMYESSDKSRAAVEIIQDAVAALNPSGRLEMHFIIGDADESLFDSLGYVFLGVIAFFLIFIISGMALVRERSAGTLERILMTPVKRTRVILGYTAGYGFFAVIQAVILVTFSIYVLGIPCEGNVALVVLMMLLLAVAAVAFGELISIFSNTEFQVVQLIPVAIIPQIFFTGLIPLDTIPLHLGNLCYIMPVYYGCAAIKEVMLVGSGLFKIWPFIIALLIYITFLSILNTLALKKYRKI